MLVKFASTLHGTNGPVIFGHPPEGESAKAATHSQGHRIEKNKKVTCGNSAMASNRDVTKYGLGPNPGLRQKPAHVATQGE